MERCSHATARYTLLQGSYWANYCSLLTFSSVYFLSLGFRNAQIGLLISLSCGLSALLQPVVSQRADRLKRLSLREFTAGLLLFQLGVNGLLLVLPGKLAQMLLYCVLLILMQLAFPLCSALGMECVNRGIPLQFGVARGGGSVIYGVVSALCGKLVLWQGEGILPWVILLTNLILLLSVVTFRFSGKETIPPQNIQPLQDSPSQGKKRPFLLRYPGMTLLLVGVVCLHLSHSLLNTFAFQIVRPLGGTSDQMGTLLLIQSLAELPVMFGFNWLLRKSTSRFWLQICGIAFFLHALGTWLSPGMGWLYAIQITEMPGYALYALASIYWINETAAPEDRVQGQAHFAMAMTLGSVLASLSGGLLLDHASVFWMLAFSTAAGGVGMAVLLGMLRKGRSWATPSDRP